MNKKTKREERKETNRTDLLILKKLLNTI